MKTKFGKFEEKIIKFFSRIETKKRKKNKSYTKNVLPNYVLNRRIKIITNGQIVFDSDDLMGEKIPYDIQCSIKQYGYPEKKIKSNNKTPLIYNINSNVSSVFPSKEDQECCINNIN